MHYALLSLTVLLLALQKIGQKRFSAAIPSGAFLFGSMISLCAMAVFGLTTAARQAWSWDPILLVPAVGFGLSYAVGTVFTVLAIRYGSLARTTLITSYSLLVPALAGLLLLDEPLTVLLVVGILLVALSLWLTNYRRTGGENPITLKWVLCVSLGFAGNGLCSAVQKLAPYYIPGEALNANVYMTVALGLSAVLLLAVSILTREPNRRDTLRRGAPWALLCGLCNGGVNLLVLHLNGVLPASVMFPTMSVGQIILICLYAKFVCRERHTKGQWAGFAVGMAAVLLLNLA